MNFVTRVSISLALTTAAVALLPGQTFSTLHSFGGADGSHPYATLVQGLDGNLYGTTQGGGKATPGGTVFKYNPGGTFTSLYDFCEQACLDGFSPATGLVLAANGDFYGTTSEGSSNFGTVFKFTPSDQLTVLYDFCPENPCSDGQSPAASLVQAINGDLYGTTQVGGDFNAGNIFKITPSGSFTLVYSFCSQSGCPDGQYPRSGLMLGADGSLYGTTSAGGLSQFCTLGCGTIFKITPAGALTTLYEFCADGGCPDGQFPEAALVQAANGVIYGTTNYGGAHQAGTIFEITPKGKLTTLYSFCSQDNCADGGAPVAALTLGSDGNLYGTTPGASCPLNGCGTIFRITPAGAFTLLYTLNEITYAGLVQDTNGAFYGTTYSGGNTNLGTVFLLGVGLGPFVTSLPTTGKVGASIRILGSDLGSALVEFNGTEAISTLISSSEIAATIPTGATTGPITAGNGGETLTSNVPFRILP